MLETVHSGKLQHQKEDQRFGALGKGIAAMEVSRMVLRSAWTRIHELDVEQGVLHLNLAMVSRTHDPEKITGSVVAQMSVTVGDRGGKMWSLHMTSSARRHEYRDS